MGIPDSSLIDLIGKVMSWMSWGASEPSGFTGEFRQMSGDSCNICCLCETKIAEIDRSYRCRCCARVFCGKCVQGYQGSPGGDFSEDDVKDSNDTGESIKVCKFCCGAKLRKYGEKVHPSSSPPESPESSFLCTDDNRVTCCADCESDHSGCLAPNAELQRNGDSSCALSHEIMTPSSRHLARISFCRSPSRREEEDAGDSGRHYFSPSSECFQENSDIDMHSVSTRFEPDNFQSQGSSPFDSPSRVYFAPSRDGHPVQQMRGKSLPSPDVTSHEKENMALLEKPGPKFDVSQNVEDCPNKLPESQSQYDMLQKPLDFEKNELLWAPPSPEYAGDEEENNFFQYDDEDDDFGGSGLMFSSSSSLSAIFPKREKQKDGNEEPLKTVVQGHFRALVSELLQSEGIKESEENGMEDWLDIVTALAWQAANFVKPDTKKGGSMDPGDYVKVKCIASGSPRDSTLVKGVVCTKNIKHKRMTSQYKNPRLLILGGALDYQRVPNELASFNTLIQEENYHMKMVVSKIEALHPNVLLVEKSVSSVAQEQLLEKEISLVLNVKRPLLARIARCTGAYITPSVDFLSTTRLGHCELFRIEKISEEHETAYQSSKKFSKTLMFFEGCPRRLGCTVLLRGACREELKKVKHVVIYAVFAAYHLSLETSFLADEGATLPKMAKKQSTFQDKRADDNAISAPCTSVESTSFQASNETNAQDVDLDLYPQVGRQDSFPKNLDLDPLPSSSVDYLVEDRVSDDQNNYLASDSGPDISMFDRCKDQEGASAFSYNAGHSSHLESHSTIAQWENLEDAQDLLKAETPEDNEVTNFSTADTHQSILVSFSSRCITKETVCERSRLLRIKFYGCFDKPLGRYLRDDLLDQDILCESCQEPLEYHVQCYTHQQGSLTINVKRLKPKLKLPGEPDGKIWMWHRCLRCPFVDGVPPPTSRVVMSDAAWGLSFGKFLELSFSNHATANRVAICGHSLQRDCLRYYGFGSMVAFFRYSPIDLLSVNLPPSVLEFNDHVQQDWICKEAEKVKVKMETLFEEISDALDSIEEKCKLSQNDTSELQDRVTELKNHLENEKNDYRGLLHPTIEPSQQGQPAMDILEMNQLRRSLLICSRVWDQHLSRLDTLLKANPISKASLGLGQLKDVKLNQEDEPLKSFVMREPLINEVQSDQKEEPKSVSLEVANPGHSLKMSGHNENEEERQLNGDGIPSHASNLSERIDSAWTGTEQLPQELKEDVLQAGSVGQISQSHNPSLRRLVAPMRNHSFDSALRVQERIRRGLPPSSLHLSTIRSFHAFGDYRNMVRDPLSSVMRTYSQMMPWETLRLNLEASTQSSFIPSAFHLAEEARLLLPQRGCNDIVVAIYDNEPTSVISYALTSKEYEDWITDKFNGRVGWSASVSNKEGSVASDLSPRQSFDSLNLEYIHYGSYGSEDLSSSISSLFTDSKKSPHVKISFADESVPDESKVKFSVTCYFAKEFDVLRKNCCPSDVDFIRSMSRCRKWNAQGGKSNAYFAKSLDERFIIKQVSKTELESFEDFASRYFKYLNESLSWGSPTCLAKVLGMYQVTVKHKKDGKETKMDLMVMENLLFGKSVSRIYDLKGSLRSRYNPDTTGKNKVFFDMNLIETLRTNPLFLGSKAKRRLERAVWNDTSFLANADVMDYSLLVGVDEENRELVLGIIDYLRQYTWDKHLETWVKASGILGGPKNASPTIISPKQYKKRFRKAMSTYFLTVPDQLSS